ncbi:dj-1 family protein [Moniliophthora roreri]|nr:dj-1 family protein [Moniliophthora roreri]
MEVAVLHHLSGHENIVPFIGTLDGSLRPCIVLEWMNGGNIVQYLAEHPEESKESLIQQVVSGLLYLKERSVVHGDIKPDNILVTEHGLVRISDFGSAFFSFMGSTTSRIRASSLAPPPVGGTDRYLAPELLREDSQIPSYQSDVFSFGMTVFQIFTGAIPFPEIKHAAYASVLIVQGIRPQRSEDIPDHIWALISTCWSQGPNDRPTVQQIHKNLRAV